MTSRLARLLATGALELGYRRAHRSAAHLLPRKQGATLPALSGREATAPCGHKRSRRCRQATRRGSARWSAIPHCRSTPKAVTRARLLPSGESSSPPCDRRGRRPAVESHGRQQRDGDVPVRPGRAQRWRLVVGVTVARDASPRDQLAASGRLRLLATRRGARQRCGRSGRAGPACRLAPGKRQSCGRRCGGCLFQTSSVGRVERRGRRCCR